nr:hypothetical protein [Tanacetum cinerariifolium]
MEDDDKDLNVFDYDCEVYSLSTKTLFGGKEFFVNKKQQKDLCKIKKVKLSDVDAMNNDYELADNSPKWYVKVVTELVVLEVIDLEMEKERPLSCLVNKEGPTYLIKVLFYVFDPDGEWVFNLGGFSGMSNLNKRKLETNCRLVYVLSVGSDMGSLDDKFLDYVVIWKKEEHEDDRKYNIREVWSILKNELGRRPYGDDYPKTEDRSEGTPLFRIGNTLENHVYVVETNGELISRTILVFDPGGVKVFGIRVYEEGMEDFDKCLGLSTRCWFKEEVPRRWIGKGLMQLREGVYFDIWKCLVPAHHQCVHLRIGRSLNKDCWKLLVDVIRQIHDVPNTKVKLELSCSKH